MKKQQFGEGKGKTLAALTSQHNRMVQMGKAPQVKAAPIKVHQHHKPILDVREEEKDAAGQIGFKHMRKPGRSIGHADLKSEGKWRCATCKQANEAHMESCGRCRDPKKVLIEKIAPAARSNSQGAAAMNQGPMRFTNNRVGPQQN